MQRESDQIDLPFVASMALVPAPSSARTDTRDQQKQNLSGSASELASFGLTYVESIQAFICTKCPKPRVIFGDRLKAHVRDHLIDNSPVRPDQVEGMIDHVGQIVSQLPAVVPTVDLAIFPEPGAPALPHLPIEDGLLCAECGHVSSSKRMIQNHFTMIHKHQPGAPKSLHDFERDVVKRVHVQMLGSTGKLKCPFWVLPRTQGHQGHSTSDPRPRSSRALDETAEEFGLLMEEAYSNVGVADLDSEILCSNWDEHTGFKKHLSGADLDLLAQLNSCQKHEITAAETILHTNVSHVYAECEEIATKYDSQVLNELKVMEASGGQAAPRSWTRLQPDTIKRYTRDMWRCLTFFLRYRHKIQEVGGRLGLAEAPEFSEALQRIQDLLDELTPRERDQSGRVRYLDRSAMAGAPLLWTVAKALTMLFVVDKIQENRFDYPLLYWMAVDNYNPLTKGFAAAKDATQTFAALLHWARILVLRQAHLEKFSAQADMPWFVVRFKELCSSNLTNRCLRPTAYVLFFLAHGKRVTAKEGKALPSVTVSENGQRFFVHSRLYQLPYLQLLPLAPLEFAENCLRSTLFFGCDDMPYPTQTYLATLSDVVDNESAGYHFASDAVNHLSKKWLKVLSLCRSSKGSAEQNLNRGKARPRRFLQDEKSAWNWPAVHEYWIKAQEFLEAMLVLVHLVAGQPARAKSLVSITFANKGRLRHIHLSDGSFVFYTDYSKNKHRGAGPAKIFRAIPHPIGQLLFVYIVYILPFLQYLEHQMRQTLDPRIKLTCPLVGSQYLWPRGLALGICHAQPDKRETFRFWDPARLTDCLRRHTKVCADEERNPTSPIPFNVSTWRQLAVELGRIVLKGNDPWAASGFDKSDGNIGEDGDDTDDDVNCSDSLAQDALIRGAPKLPSNVFDRQADHSTATALMYYGAQQPIVGDYNQFRQASKLWEGFFTPTWQEWERRRTAREECNMERDKIDVIDQATKAQEVNNVELIEQQLFRDEDLEEDWQNLLNVVSSGLECVEIDDEDGAHVTGATTAPVGQETGGASRELENVKTAAKKQPGKRKDDERSRDKENKKSGKSNRVNRAPPPRRPAIRDSPEESDGSDGSDELDDRLDLGQVRGGSRYIFQSTPPYVRLDTRRPSKLLAEESEYGKLPYHLRHATIIHLLGLFNSSQYVFRSTYQARALDLVYTQRFPQDCSLIVLPTSGGKSLLFQMMHKQFPNRVVIVVSFFRALKDSHILQCNRLGLTYHDLKKRAIEKNQRFPGGGLLLCSGEVASSKPFLQWAEDLYRTQHLAYIFVDEAHVPMLDSGWREQLKAVQKLRVLKVPKVLMTATMPPTLMEDCTNWYGPITAELRTVTQRPNLAFHVHKVTFPAQLMKAGQRPKAMWVTDDSIAEKVHRYLFDHWQALESPRSIIFVRTKVDAVDVAMEVNMRWSRVPRCDLVAKPHHSELEAKERQATVEEWLANKFRVLVCTSGFGTGVDVSNVRLVIHLDEQYSFTDYVQQVGRAGRDGKEAKILSLYSNRAIIMRESKEELSDEKQAYLEFLSTKGCRRIPMSTYMDGVPVSCRSIGGSLCDRCQKDTGRKGRLDLWVNQDPTLRTSSPTRPDNGLDVPKPPALPLPRPGRPPVNDHVSCERLPRTPGPARSQPTRADVEVIVLPSSPPGPTSVPSPPVPSPPVPSPPVQFRAPTVFSWPSSLSSLPSNPDQRPTCRKVVDDRENEEVEPDVILIRRSSNSHTARRTNHAPSLVRATSGESPDTILARTPLNNPGTHRNSSHGTTSSDRKLKRRRSGAADEPPRVKHGRYSANLTSSESRLTASRNDGNPPSDPFICSIGSTPWSSYDPKAATQKPPEQAQDPSPTSNVPPTSVTVPSAPRNPFPQEALDLSNLMGLSRVFHTTQALSTPSKIFPRTVDSPTHTNRPSPDCFRASPLSSSHRSRSIFAQLGQRPAVEAPDFSSVIRPFPGDSALPPTEDWYSSPTTSAVQASSNTSFGSFPSMATGFKLTPSSSSDSGHMASQPHRRTHPPKSDLPQLSAAAAMPTLSNVNAVLTIEQGIEKLRLLQGQCVNCVWNKNLYGYPEAKNHNLWNCWDEATKDLYKDLKQHICLAPGITGRGFCWKCHCPDSLCRKRCSTGNLHSDIVFPTVFHFWIDEAKREQLFQWFPVTKAMSNVEFGRWLGKSTPLTSPYFMWKVFVRIMSGTDFQEEVWRRELPKQGICFGDEPHR